MLGVAYDVWVNELVAGEQFVKFIVYVSTPDSAGTVLPGLIANVVDVDTGFAVMFPDPLQVAVPVVETVKLLLYPAASSDAYAAAVGNELVDVTGPEDPPPPPPPPPHPPSKATEIDIEIIAIVLLNILVILRIEQLLIFDVAAMCFCKGYVK